jgi:hypothetical protein
LIAEGSGAIGCALMEQADSSLPLNFAFFELQLFGLLLSSFLISNFRKASR